MPRSPALRRLLRRARRALRQLAREVGWRRRPRLRRATWTALGLAVAAAANAGYQVARKPTELVGAIAPSARKSPRATWAAYGPLFRAHATAVVDAPLLAALAQVESAGDPLARTYWRWRWSWNPLELYAPASSAAGLMQLTEGTYEEARRACARGRAWARPGEEPEPRACGLLGASFRLVPGHAIELTAAWLDDAVAHALARARRPRARLAARQRLATVVHLCGRERGVAFARRGFWALPGERCGDHDLALYLARVATLRAAFARMEREVPAGFAVP